MNAPLVTYQTEYRDVLHSLAWAKADREAARIRAEICENHPIGTLVFSPCYTCDGAMDEACVCKGAGWVAREIEECPTCQGTGRQALTHAPRRRDAIDQPYRLAVCGSCDGVGKVVCYFEKSGL